MLRTFLIKTKQNVRFIFNAQCCPQIEGQFVVNTHALHNAHLIRRELPHLTQPVPRYDEHCRIKKHRQWAEGLRVSGPAKRAATTVKANATRQKNKDKAQQQKAKETQATIITASGLSPEGLIIWLFSDIDSILVDHLSSHNHFCIRFTSGSQK
jgi:hypothetical protein